jgi:hypothetical protein
MSMIWVALDLFAGVIVGSALYMTYMWWRDR